MPRYQPLSLGSPTTPSTNTNTIPRSTSHSSGSRRRTVLPPALHNCLASLSQSPYIPSRSQIIGYISGTLFAVAWWVFFDGILFSATREPPVPVTVRFEDWIPGLLSTISLIIVNLIDKHMLSGDAEDSWAGGSSFASSSSVAGKARGCAFLGVSMALGALGGAAAILCLKYILPGYEGDSLYLGISIIVQNVMIFFSSMVLWFGRNSFSSDDGYDIRL
ncbi:hypothetical protein BC832DRAFT_106691 [Gaertneriomyces semiglobifer]|nr:hypothetical protein BC832DRAFT_106691 [Gaertneriomyces semiglobifer]